MKTQKMAILITAVFTAAMLFVSPVAFAGEKAIAPASSESQMAPSQTKVMGTIIAEKDNSGKIIGYLLQEAGGQSVAVSTQGKGEQLQNMVGKRVEVVGTLEESQGSRTITVTEFKEIE